jgi:hypothetical protein
MAMNELINTAGLNGQGMDIAERLVFAIQGTLILFFVVSPIMGYIIARQIKDRTRVVIGVCMGMLIVIVGNMGLNLLLLRLLPEGTLPDWAIALLSFAASGAIGMIVAKYILWVLAEPGTPEWLKEDESRPYEELAPFEKRRRDEMARRKAIRGDGPKRK